MPAGTACRAKPAPVETPEWPCQWPEVFAGSPDIGVWRSLASAPRSGRGGRRFESGHPDFRRFAWFVPVQRLVRDTNQDFRAVAQFGSARVHGVHEVAGSSPASPTCGAITAT